MAKRKPKVKPCPCCGSTAIYVGALSAVSYGVICRGNCGLRTETHIHDADGTEAIRTSVQAWNLRKPVDDLLETIADLQEEIEERDELEDAESEWARE